MKDEATRFNLQDFMVLDQSESYLHDMSNKGLHLRKIGRMFLCFERGEPTTFRYRLVFAKQDDEGDKRQTECSAQCGWKHIEDVRVFGKAKLRIFRAVEDPDIPELQPDFVKQVQALKEYQRLQCYTALMLVLLILLAIFMQIYPLWMSGGASLLDIINRFSVTPLYTSLLLVMGAIAYIPSYFHTRRLRASLTQGIPIDHHADWRPGRRRMLIVLLLGMSTWVVFVVGLIFMLSMPDRGNLADAPADLPIVRLAAIEDRSALDLSDADQHEANPHSANMFREAWSLYAYSCIASYEAAYGQDISPSEGPLLTTLHNEVYHLVFPFMADDVAHALMAKFAYTHGYTGWQESPHDGLDELYVNSYIYPSPGDTTGHSVCARLGNRVIFVAYGGGYASEEALIEACLRALRGP